MGQVALVTGGNRGIGFEVCRSLAREGLTVLLGSRNPSLGRGAATELAAEGLDVRLEVIDVAIEESVKALADRLATVGPPVDEAVPW